MKLVFASVALLGLLASPARADQKLDDAVAKAEEQVAEGQARGSAEDHAEGRRPSPSSEAFQWPSRASRRRLGNFDEARRHAKAAGSAPERPATKADDARRGRQLSSSARHRARTRWPRPRKRSKARPRAVALAALARAEARARTALAALASADKAIAAGASSAVGARGRGDALVALGQVRRGRRPSTRRPSSSTRSYQRAGPGSPRSSLSAARRAEAVAEAKKATELDPKSGEAFAALGLALLAENPKANWSDAIAQAQQGVFLNPRTPSSSTSRGQDLRGRRATSTRP